MFFVGLNVDFVAFRSYPKIFKVLPPWTFSASRWRKRKRTRLLDSFGPVFGTLEQGVPGVTEE